MEYREDNRVVFISTRSCRCGLVVDARCFRFGETRLTNIIQGFPFLVTLRSWRSSVIIYLARDRIVEKLIAVLYRILCRRCYGFSFCLTSCFGLKLTIQFLE